ncbi:hypothetical protein K435DRAFT_514790 [Dendrothele bispora CBS 962.96]|uniref:Homeobox domain-containing protein n=1 Tax=Dendrothele bispora (strain CBS 962.96) TaxID=1314807 RepID=A0A4S8M9D2_DENBC|nr:hypothetical protein K435DRAFT_514790 [Dendrothele bispora CBS 962.96]
MSFQRTKIPPANLQELHALLDADPAKRLPSLISRRRWAEARNLDVDVVHRWWRRQRFKAKKNKYLVSDAETYDIPVGTPPIIDPETEEQQLSATKIKTEDKDIVIKTEASAVPVMFKLRDAPYTRARARAARVVTAEHASEYATAGGMTPSRLSSSPRSSPSSTFFYQSDSSDTAPSSPPSSASGPESSRKRAYTDPNVNEDMDIYQLSLPEPSFCHEDSDMQTEKSQPRCTFGSEDKDGFVCQLCSMSAPDTFTFEDMYTKELPSLEALYTHLTGGVFSSWVDDSSISWQLSAIPFESRSPDMLPSADYVPSVPFTHTFQDHASSFSPSVFVLDGYEFTYNGHLVRKCDSLEGNIAILDESIQKPFTLDQLARDPFDYLPSIDTIAEVEALPSTVVSRATTPADTIVAQSDFSSSSTTVSPAATPEIQDDAIIVKSEPESDDKILFMGSDDLLS